MGQKRRSMRRAGNMTNLYSIENFRTSQKSSFLWLLMMVGVILNEYPDTWRWSGPILIDFGSENHHFPEILEDFRWFPWWFWWNLEFTENHWKSRHSIENDDFWRRKCSKSVPITSNYFEIHLENHPASHCKISYWFVPVKEVIIFCRVFEFLSKERDTFAWFIYSFLLIFY